MHNNIILINNSQEILLVYEKNTETSLDKTTYLRFDLNFTKSTKVITFLHKRGFWRVILIAKINDDDETTSILS